MSTLSYRDFTASVEFDPDDLILVGRLVGIKDFVSFHGEDGASLVAAFHGAVDDYIATCESLGRGRAKPYSGKLMLRVDPDVHAQAARVAQAEGKSLNAWSEEVLRQAALRSLGVKVERQEMAEA